MKKKHPEHVNLERWLVSYADFITLLFAFFVVMYAIANQDKAKIKQIKESIDDAFMGPSSKLDLGTGKEINILTAKSSAYGKIMDQSMGHTHADPYRTPELEKIARQIEDSLAYQLQTTDLKDILQLVYNEDGLALRMSANKLFEPGREDVKPNYWKLLDKISEILYKTDRLIRIEGHTDSQPVGENARFPTNWELSSARAAWIVRYMIAKWQVPAACLGTSGFAHSRPVAENTSPEGRERNRRVEIVVTNVRSKECTAEKKSEAN